MQGSGTKEKGGQEMKVANEWHKQSERVEMTEMGLGGHHSIETGQNEKKQINEQQERHVC
jgi:hypothetical protein